MKQMLALREHIFAGYSQQEFECALGLHARIEKRQQVSKEDRMLYWYERG